MLGHKCNISCVAATPLHERSLVFFPMNMYNQHWWLAVAVHPGRAVRPKLPQQLRPTPLASDEPRPTLIYLDPLGGKYKKGRRHVHQHLIDYLAAVSQLPNRQ